MEVKEHIKLSVTRDPRARALIVQCYAKGARVCDIAKALSVNPNSITSIVRRGGANKRLRDYSVNLADRLVKDIIALKPIENLYEIQEVNGKYAVTCVLDGKVRAITDNYVIAKKILNTFQERRGRKSTKQPTNEREITKSGEIEIAKSDRKMDAQIEKDNKAIEQQNEKLNDRNQLFFQPLQITMVE